MATITETTEKTEPAEKQRLLQEWEESLKEREDKLQKGGEKPKSCQGMHEARYSINFSFFYKGFRTQLTMRDNESVETLVQNYVGVLNDLIKGGAIPELKAIRSNGNGNAKTANGDSEEQRKCVKCGSADIHFVGTSKAGKVINRWVCNSCNAWQPR